MSIVSLFQEVRPVKMFSNKVVSKELILEILEVSVWAPNHKHTEPWRFIYAEGEAKEKLVLANEENGSVELAQTIAAASVCLIVTAKKSADVQINSDDFAAVCALIQNIQLLSWAKGLGMSWRLEDYKGNKDFLMKANIREDEQLVGVLAIGYLDDLAEKRIRTMEAPKIEIW